MCNTFFHTRHVHYFTPCRLHGYSFSSLKLQGCEWKGARPTLSGVICDSRMFYLLKLCSSIGPSTFWLNKLWSVTENLRRIHELKISS